VLFIFTTVVSTTRKTCVVVLRVVLIDYLYFSCLLEVLGVKFFFFEAHSRVRAESLSSSLLQMSAASRSHRSSCLQRRGCRQAPPATLGLLRPTASSSTSRQTTRPGRPNLRRLRLLTCPAAANTSGRASCAARSLPCSRATRDTSSTCTARTAHTFVCSAVPISSAKTISPRTSSIGTCIRTLEIDRVQAAISLIYLLLLLQTVFLFLAGLGQVLTRLVALRFKAIITHFSTEVFSCQFKCQLIDNFSKLL